MENEEKNKELKPIEKESNQKITPKVFINDSLGKLRTATDEYGRAVFCLKDACEILEIKNPSDASKRLKKSGIVKIAISDGKKNNSFLFVTESNLYRLIFQSRKEEAAQFVDWVTEIVLPEIRRHGKYELKELMKSEDSALTFLDSYNDLKIKLCILEKVNKETEEARAYVKRALDSGVLKDLMDVPEILNITGIGKKQLFSILREAEVLDKDNFPYQAYVDKGWFRVDTHSYIDKTAGLTTHRRCFVYQVGITQIRKILDRRIGKKNGK